MSSITCSRILATRSVQCPTASGSFFAWILAGSLHTSKAWPNIPQGRNMPANFPNQSYSSHQYQVLISSAELELWNSNTTLLPTTTTLIQAWLIGNVVAFHYCGCIFSTSKTITATWHQKRPLERDTHAMSSQEWWDQHDELKPASQLSWRSTTHKTQPFLSLHTPKNTSPCNTSNACRQWWHCGDRIDGSAGHLILVPV